MRARAAGDLCDLEAVGSQPGVEKGRIGEVCSTEPVPALDRGGQVNADNLGDPVVLIEELDDEVAGAHAQEVGHLLDMECVEERSKVVGVDG